MCNTEQLVSYVYDELSDSERAEFEGHLSSCVECRQELAELRAQMPHAPLLVPGYGSQGGTAADVAAAFDDEGLGAVVNSSRGIIFAYRKGPNAERFGPDRWEDAVAAATHDMIADLAANTPCGAPADSDVSPQ